MLGNTSKIIILLLLCFLAGETTEASYNQEYAVDKVLAFESKIPQNVRINDDGRLVWDDLGKLITYYNVYCYNSLNLNEEGVVYEVARMPENHSGFIYFDLSTLDIDEKEEFSGFEYYRVSAVWEDEWDKQLESNKSAPVRSGGFLDIDGTELYMDIYTEDDVLIWKSQNDALFYKVYYSDKSHPKRENMEVLDVVENHSDESGMIQYKIPLYYRLLLFSSSYFWVVPVNLSGEGPLGNSVYIKGIFDGD